MPSTLTIRASLVSVTNLPTKYGGNARFAPTFKIVRHGRSALETVIFKIKQTRGI
jgi:hypothetical protein